MALPRMAKSSSKMHIDPNYRETRKVIDEPNPYNKFSRRSRTPNSSANLFSYGQSTLDLSHNTSTLRTLSPSLSRRHACRPDASKSFSLDRDDGSMRKLRRSATPPRDGNEVPEKSQIRTYTPRTSTIATHKSGDPVVLQSTGHMHLGGIHVGGEGQKTSVLFRHPADEPVKGSRFWFKTTDELRGAYRYQHTSKINTQSEFRERSQQPQRFNSTVRGTSLVGVLNEDPNKRKSPTHVVRPPYATH